MWSVSACSRRQYLCFCPCSFYCPALLGIIEEIKKWKTFCQLLCIGWNQKLSAVLTVKPGLCFPDHWNLSCVKFPDQLLLDFIQKKNRDVQPVRPSWELKIWVIFALGENRNTSFCEMEAFLWVFCFDLMEMSFAFIILHLKRSNSSYWCKIFWLPQNEVLP